MIENLRGGVANVCEDAVAELKESLAGRRHLHAADRSNEQRLGELLLEQQDLAADRRLRDVQLRASLGERAGLGNGAQDLQLTQVHGGILLARLRTQATCVFDSLLPAGRPDL